MTDAQVGTSEDIVSGQINGFFGTDMSDSTGAGICRHADRWPGVDAGVRLAEELRCSRIDYYDIKINDYIGEFGAQEVLDACYVAGIDCGAAQRSTHRRHADGATGSGVQMFTTNLEYLQAEGIELQA